MRLCHGFDVPAVLHELEQLGLLAAPHTSAGRIPTARGHEDGERRSEQLQCFGHINL